MTLFDWPFYVWVLDKGTGGIVSEYTKRFWFEKILQQKVKSDNLRLELEKTQKELWDLKGSIANILTQNIQLQTEIIYLENEISDLKKTY